MMSIAELVRERIQQLPKGEPFTPKSLLVLGSRASIDQTLSRLARSGELMRVTRGVYVRPKRNRFVGLVPPDPQRVVETIASATGEKVQVHGAEAALRLELTTQVPTQPVFYTTGRNRTLFIGKLRVQMKHASPRKLALAGTRAGLALVALWDLGPRAVTPTVIESVRRKLSRDEFTRLKAAAASMPTWMVEAIARADEIRSD